MKRWDEAGELELAGSVLPASPHMAWPKVCRCCLVAFPPHHQHRCERVQIVHLPPRVAEMRMWVPYFLMMVSMNCCVVGLLPRRRMLLWNSGIRGSGLWSRSLRSMAVFLTFQRANSLHDKTGTQEG